LLASVASTFSLAQAADMPTWELTLRNAINTSLGGVTQGQLSVDQVNETPMEGLYEVVMNSGEILLTDRSGQFLIAGELYMTRPEGLINLTANTKQLQVKALIEDIPEEQMIIFAPDNP